MIPSENEEKHKIIDSLWTLWIAVLLAGPLALPLLWRNPRFGKRTKIWLTVIVAVLTIFLMWVTLATYQEFLERYEMLLNPPG